MKRIPTLVLAFLIVAGPAAAQLFQIDTPVFRPWKMYGTVAIGAAFGNFEIRSADAPARLVAVFEALNLSRYREQQPYPGSGAIVRDLSGNEALAEVAGPLCKSLREDESLSFNGRVATRHRWMDVELNHQALCGNSQ